jgi:hypothetical protein
MRERVVPLVERGRISRPLTILSTRAWLIAAKVTLRFMP